MASVAVEFPEDYPVRMISLRVLKDSCFIQSRVKTDAGHARKITEFVLKNGPINEPIVVFDDGKDLYTADGIHRVIGYRQAARVEKRFQHIRAEVRPGTAEDAIVYSAGANQTKTYLERTKDDIRNAVWTLLDIPSWRSKAPSFIAEHIGIHHPRASRLVREYFAEKKIPSPEVLEGRDGRTITPRRKEGRSPRIRTDREGSVRARFFASVDGEQVHLGDASIGLAAAKEVLEQKMAERQDARESPRKVISLKSQDSLRSYLASKGIFAKAFLALDERDQFRGIKASCGPGFVLSCTEIDSPEDLLLAIVRAILAKQKTKAGCRAVVVCYPEKAASGILQLSAELGVEFMTPDEFVASLKPEGESTPTPESP